MFTAAATFRKCKSQKNWSTEKIWTIEKIDLFFCVYYALGFLDMELKTNAFTLENLWIYLLTYGNLLQILLTVNLHVINNAKAHSKYHVDHTKYDGQLHFVWI